MLDKESIRANLESVQARIAAATKLAGRDAATIRMVAVTKGHPVEAISILQQLGVLDIGESYVEDAREKQALLGQTPSLKWHMIGHIQSRKAQLVAGNFDLVHSVDTLKLARRLDRFAGEASRKLAILLECNVSAEVSKTGWPVWNNEGETAFMKDVAELVMLKNLEPHGLMTIAPVIDRPDQAKAYFKKLRMLRDKLAEKVPQTYWRELSMGMSDDFESAITEGATLVRIGTAILGPRQN